MPRMNVHSGDGSMSLGRRDIEQSLDVHDCVVASGKDQATCSSLQSSPPALSDGVADSLPGLLVADPNGCSAPSGAFSEAICSVRCPALAVVAIMMPSEMHAHGALSLS